MISLLLFPFLTCVLLVLVHVYFGAFVLRRGILFVDLALAQWAALGYLVGHVLDIHHPVFLYGLGFTFTLFAALVIALLYPLYKETQLQEAVIGVMYISATAIATSLIAVKGLEGHHLKEMLTGHLLFIQPSEWLFTALIYATVGLLLFLCHRHFLSGASRFWDFVFYVLFGCIVTSSVKLVGILLVFSYLVLPLLSVIRHPASFNGHLFLGWGIGIFSSIVGLSLSIVTDIPPSFCVILTLCVAWILGITHLTLFSKTK